MKTEKKSEHTIRSYVVAAKTFTTTPLPNEEIISWNEIKEIQVSEWNYSFEGPHKFTKDRDIVSLAKELVDACRTGTFQEKEVKLDD